MKILLTTAGFPPAYLGGGPIRTIEAMLKAAPDRHEVLVLTSNHDLGCQERLVEDNADWVDTGTALVRYVDRGARAWAAALRQGLAARPDAVYLNSLFSPRYSLSVIAALRARPSIPLVIAPRGELSPGALAIKSGKKRAFLALLRSGGFVSRAVWHASAALEAEDIRRVFGADARVIVREDDTDLPSRASLLEATAGRDEVRPLRVVFMSRLSPKKGLHVLLEALGAVTAQVEVTVVGPEEDRAYAARCRAAAAELPGNVRVRFTGAVPHERMRPVLADFDVMALPTAGENFGHVIAEALSVGCPLLLTDTTPWSDLVTRHRAGEILPDQDPWRWAQTLDRHAAAGPRRWRETRERAAQAYDDWRGEGRRPHFFDLLEQALTRGA